MSFLAILIISIGLSMDAFAVAVCSGLTMCKVTVKKSFIVGAYFGVFQAAMPLIGFLLATRFTSLIESVDHWIAFVLLSFIGGKMVAGAFKKKAEQPSTPETTLNPREMLPLAVATSIDALAVGISFAFLKVDIIPAVLTIGLTTLLLSMLGVKLGSIFGMKFKSKAELAGGIILILMGLKILLEHTGIL